MPKTIDIAPLLEEAKRQLHKEADYRQEAVYLKRFSRRLADDSRFELPTVIESLTTPEVLAMSYLDGKPIESLTNTQASVRETVGASLLELALREVFDWGLVQTDPNFANYRFQPESRRLQLLDFGATREYSASRRAAFRALLLACVDGDDEDVSRSAIDVGYIDENDANSYRASVIALLRTATEPVRKTGNYAFGVADLARRMSDIAIDLRLRERFGRLPPTDVLFLHRKLGGLYLLLSHLRATIPVRQLIKPFLEQAGLQQCPADERLAG